MTNMLHCAPILSVEDEETDRFLLRVAHKKSGLQNPLVFADDGQAAVDYFDGKPPFQDRGAHPLPGLILLDLKMPRMDGFDVLAWLAKRPEFRQLPVVILSSSSNEADIQKAREMGALDYRMKSADLQELVSMMRDLAQRWPVEQSQLA